MSRILMRRCPGLPVVLPWVTASIGRSLLCASSFLNRCNGGHRQPNGGDGCDGTWFGEYHPHLHALERAADQGSDGAAEPVISDACGSCAKTGHKSGHSRLKQPYQEML